MLVVNGKTIATDDFGYLRNSEDWDEEVAKTLAKKENIELNENHWQVIYYIRQFYQRFNKSPAIRPLIKYLQQNLPEAEINSIRLAKLFPAGAAKQSSKLAGLPKPTRCI